MFVEDDNNLFSQRVLIWEKNHMIAKDSKVLFFPEEKHDSH